MKEKNIIYYLIRERILAKREHNEEIYEDYIFKNGEWVVDEKYRIMDYLEGFDPSEPEDSPYRFGNTSVMMEIDEISEEKAKEIMNQYM